MKIILITNNPIARSIFELACATNSPKVLDFRNLPSSGYEFNDSLSYVLGNRYTHVDHSRFIVSTLKHIAEWRWPNLPFIVITGHAVPDDTLRFAIWSKFPEIAIETRPSSISSPPAKGLSNSG